MTHDFSDLTAGELDALCEAWRTGADPAGVWPEWQAFKKALAADPELSAAIASRMRAARELGEVVRYSDVIEWAHGALADLGDPAVRKARPRRFTLAEIAKASAGREPSGFPRVATVYDEAVAADDAGEWDDYHDAEDDDVWSGLLAAITDDAEVLAALRGRLRAAGGARLSRRRVCEMVRDILNQTRGANQYS